MSKRGSHVYCSFCGKHQDYVEVIIAGPSDVFICDECVELCVDIVQKNRTEKAARKT